MKLILSFLFGLTLSAQSQPFTVGDASLGALSQAAAAVSQTCVTNVEQTTDNDFWSAIIHSQGVTNNTVTRQVCSLLVKPQGGTGSYYVQLRSAKNGGGSQIGDNSDTNTWPVSAAWQSVVWSAPRTAPTVSSDFVINIINVGGTNAYVRTASTNPYAGTSYFYSQGNTDKTGSDLCFILGFWQ